MTGILNDAGVGVLGGYLLWELGGCHRRPQAGKVSREGGRKKKLKVLFLVVGIFDNGSKSRH